jgi:hypothetical protein
MGRAEPLCQSVSKSECLPTHKGAQGLADGAQTSQSFGLSICLPACQLAHPYACIPVCLSIRPSV